MRENARHRDLGFFACIILDLSCLVPRLLAMHRTCLSGFLFTCFLGSSFIFADEGEDLSTRPSPEKGPTEVLVRMMILNIEQIKGAEQSFTGDFGFQAEWQDDRLRHSSSERVTKKMDDVWTPGFQILNRQRVQYTFPEEVEISSSGNVRLTQRVWGQFSQPLQLRDFPFDSQLLQVTFVSPGHNDGAVVLRKNPESGFQLADSFSISDWRLVGSSSEVSERQILTGGRVVPTYQASINMHRNPRYFYINVILPLVLIICMSWIVFWIPSSQMGPRISVSVTAMLTLTAYRFAIGSSLPKIGYLTRLDWFILGSSILVFLSLFQVVVTSSLVEKEKADVARKINVSMRIVAPVLFLIIAYASLFLGRS